MNIEIFTQSAIKLSGDINIYFDPFKIEKSYNDADYIFITHDHYDHYDEEAIKKVIKDSTKVIVPKVLEEDVKKITSNYLVVEPNKEYKLDNLKFTTIPAYNISKSFHPKEKGYIGYNLEYKNILYYIMGDTDVTEEIKNVKCDFCFVPIGGYYTMDYKKATTYINNLKPAKVIPIHYGSIVGDITLGEKFKELINKDIEVLVYLKEELK